jgi:hypothetical protein
LPQALGTPLSYACRIAQPSSSVIAVTVPDVTVKRRLAFASLRGEQRGAPN